MNCNDCALRNAFPADVYYCLALCQFIKDTEDPPCEGKHHTLKNDDIERHEELLAAVRKLAAAKKLKD